MTHVHPPGTPEVGERDYFLVDGCPRCAEYVATLGLHFDAIRLRAFWAKMVEVEFDEEGRYGSDFDRELGRQLYLVALGLHRAFGLNPRLFVTAEA